MTTSIEENTGPAVLFVGKRAGAFQAARTLGLRVLLLADRPPKRSERDVIATYEACDFSAPHVDWAALGRQLSRHHKLEAVFPLTERAVLPAAIIRQEMGLPGLDVETALRCTDKLLMKRAIRAAGLPCADFMATDGRQPGCVYAKALGLPLVLKARRGSGGRGTQVFASLAEAPDLFPADCLAEGFVSGVEMSVESLVYQGQSIFTNCTEYLKPGWANIVPASLPAETRSAVQAVNSAAIEALGVTTGLTHLEVFLTETDVVFGELAARPPGGHIMELIATAYGFDLWQAWIRFELGRLPSLPQQAERSAGVWILHPGPGRLTRLDGQEAAAAVEGVRRVSLRVKVGDQIGERQGVGQEAGHILAVTSSREQTAANLKAAHQQMRIRGCDLNKKPITWRISIT